jgi:ketosteroid isomerase-like protein
MSQENVEIVQQLVDAIAEQDLSRLLELTDPDVTWQSFFAALREGATYRGHEGIRQYVSDIADTFDLVKVQIDDTLTVGDMVVVVGRLRYRGKGSGVESDAAAGYLLQIRDGRIVLVRAFRDPGDALRNLGLPE